MGQCCRGCKSPTEVELVHTRYLVDDTYFISKEVKVIHKKRGKTQAGLPLCVWVSVGMPKDRPHLTAMDKHIVKESWAFLRARMDTIGLTTFYRLFRAIPRMEKLILSHFSPEGKHCQSGICDVDKQSSDVDIIIKRHVIKVMESVDKAVQILHSRKELEDHFHHIGNVHATVTIRIEYMDCFIPFFVSAIEPLLVERGAKCVEVAWADFFRYAMHLMKESMYM